jgi:phosphatidylinositol-3-phosphatase
VRARRWGFSRCAVAQSSIARSRRCAGPIFAAGKRMNNHRTCLVVAVSACTSTPNLATTDDALQQPSKIAIVVFENRSASELTSDTAPYLTSLASASTSLSFTNYHESALTAPSLPNYIDLIAGQHTNLPGSCNDNNCLKDGNGTVVPAYTANNIGHQLNHSGIAWKGYMESMIGTCAESDSNRYGTPADPFAYFTNLACANHVVPYSQLAIDASRGAVPAYSFIVPNLCHDMHDVCAPESPQCIGKTGDALQICNGDSWASQNIPTIVTDVGPDGIVLVTFDEAGVGGGPLYTVETGPGVIGGTDAGSYNHISVLAGVEDALGVPRIRAATAGVTPLPMSID